MTASSIAPLQDFEGDRSCPFFGQFKIVGCGKREVDDTSLAVRATIVDTHDDFLVCFKFDDTYEGMKGECFMCGGEGIHVERFTASGASSVVFFAIPTGPSCEDVIFSIRAICTMGGEEVIKRITRLARAACRKDKGERAKIQEVWMGDDAHDPLDGFRFC